MPSHPWSTDPPSCHAFAATSIPGTTVLNGRDIAPWRWSPCGATSRASVSDMQVGWSGCQELVFRTRLVAMVSVPMGSRSPTDPSGPLPRNRDRLWTQLPVAGR